MKVAHLKVYTKKEGLGDVFMIVSDDETLKKVKEMDVPCQKFLGAFELPEDALDENGKPKESTKKLFREKQSQWDISVEEKEGKVIMTGRKLTGRGEMSKYAHHISLWHMGERKERDE